MDQPEQKFNRADAEKVAKGLLRLMEPVCEKIMVVGSIRRKKDLVSDIELLYIPKYGERPNLDMLFPEMKRVNLADGMLESWLNQGLLQKRPNCNGVASWGVQNKLGVWNGIPVDLFATHEMAWWTQLCMRTGGKDNNIMISREANKYNLEWHPYDGFFRQRATGALLYVKCEEDNYRLVGLDYPEPENRL